MFNGQWVSFGSTSLAPGGVVWMSNGLNCGDWRDSLWISTSKIDSTSNTFFFQQLPNPNYQPTVGRSCMADISYYKWSPVRDSFAVTYCNLYYPSGIGPAVGCALEGTINKLQDSMWLRIFRVTTNPFIKHEFCDKVLIKVK
jgi:hypothetical protein